MSAPNCAAPMQGAFTFDEGALGWAPANDARVAARVLPPRPRRARRVRFTAAVLASLDGDVAADGSLVVHDDWTFDLAHDVEGWRVEALPCRMVDGTFVVRVVTTRTETTTRVVTESFVCDDEGDWSIVAHEPREERETRVVWARHDVRAEGLWRVEAEARKAMVRPSGIGGGALCVPPKESVVALVVLAVEGGREREVFRCDRSAGGGWELPASDARARLAAALEKGRAAADAARKARAAQELRTPGWKATVERLAREAVEANAALAASSSGHAKGKRRAAKAVKAVTA